MQIVSVPADTPAPTPKKEVSSDTVNIAAEEEVAQYSGTRRIRIIESMRIYEVINSTVGSQFLMLNDKFVRNAIGSWLARAQKKYQVYLYVYVFMSNHYHLLAAAKDAEHLSDFLRYFQSNLARTLNQHRGRRGAFWSSRYKSIPVLDTASLKDRVAYIHLNPVKAGMCRKAEHSRVLSSASEMLLGKSEPFTYKEIAKDGPKKGQRVERKIRIKRSVLPHYRNLPEDDKRKALRADMKHHRANCIAEKTWPKNPTSQKQPKKWWGRSKNPPKAGETQPLCYAVEEQTKKDYLEMIKSTILRYTEAAFQYAQGKMQQANFPETTFVPSRLPERKYCGC